MTAARLTRHYPTLTPPQRFSLMLAAAARGDEAEHSRLVAAAPRVAIRVPDTFGRAVAFREVLDLHRMERLEHAALAFQAQAAATDATGEVAGRMASAARVFGYLLRVTREGWARFCDGPMVPPGALQELLPGGEVLRAAEALAGGIATEEVEAYLARVGGGVTAKVKTVESAGVAVVAP